MLTTPSDNVIPSQAHTEASSLDNSGVLPDSGAEKTSKFFRYSEIKTRLSQLVQTFDAQEGKESKLRRDLRNVDIDVKRLQEEGKLAKDNTFIPIRTIETNIAREKPPFIQYIKQPQRIMIFTPATPPYNDDCRDLDREFTKGLQYTGWELPHIKVFDGAQVHGWDWNEVEWNDAYPLQVCIEHIGHDKLIFDLEDTLDIQFAECVIRKYSVSIAQIKTFVTKYHFDPVQVNKLIESMKGVNEDKNKVIFKMYFKADSIVNVSWFCLDNGVDDYLLQPKPHFIGIKNKVTKMVQQMVPTPVTLPSGEVVTTDVPTDVPTESWEDAPLTMYPIFPDYYTITEAPKIRDKKGRAFLDEHIQQAQTALATNYVNSANRASKVYGSPTTADDSGNNPKNLNVELTRDCILDKPFEFWSFPYPDQQMLEALQTFSTINQEQTGQVNYAVINRQDSRKTAKEIQSSENQAANLTSVQVVLFSIYWRTIYTFVWKIVQSLALQGTIKFLQIPDPTQQQMPGTPPTFVNDIAKISREYDLRPAGDVDFIQRTMLIQQMKSDWPVVMGIPGLNMIFLAELMRLEYPDKGESYAEIIMQSGGLTQLMSQAAGMLEASTQTAEFKSSSPETQNQIMTVIQGLQQQSGQQQQTQKNIESAGH